MALAVLATAMGAIIKGGAEAAAGAAYLRDKPFASWEAQNRITELQVTQQWLDQGLHKGSEELAGISWLWQIEVTNTPDPNVRRLEVSVVQQEQSADHPLVRLTAFLARPS